MCLYFQSIKNTLLFYRTLRESSGWLKIIALETRKFGGCDIRQVEKPTNNGNREGECNWSYQIIIITMLLVKKLLQIFPPTLPIFLVFENENPTQKRL